MLSENDKRSKDSQNTLQSRRQRFIVKIREQQLQKIFKSLRTTILKPHFQQIISPQIQIPVQPTLTHYTPENIQLLQHYLMRFAPPQRPFYQPIIISPTNNQIQQNIQRQINPPKQYEIYFEKQNIRVFKKLLGQGSFSRVWLGIDLIRNQRIAAKQVKKLEESQQRCLKEFDSPNIIKVLKILRHRNSTFIILQFCTKNLREELVDCNYDLTKSLNYFEQIVRGMNQLQKYNIIHRDLKFQNILLSHNVIKIADFGLAKFLGDQMEIQSRRCGSPYTMAPQIYFSDTYYPSYTSKCDIWSLGIILHQMLYQQHPFGKNKQHFKKGLRIKLKKCFGILDYLIDRCLIENPKKRADWAQFLQIFQKYFINKERYLSTHFLPIQCESIVYEENPPINEQYRIDALVKKEKEVEILIQVQMEKPKVRQVIQKMINDYDANNFMQNKKVDKLKLKNKVTIQGNKKLKEIKQESKHNFKYQESKLPRIQIGKQKINSKKEKDIFAHEPLQIQQTQEVSNFKQIEENLQKYQQETKRTIIKLSKPKEEEKTSRICIQMTFLGLFTAVIIFICLFK